MGFFDQKKITLNLSKKIALRVISALEREIDRIQPPEEREQLVQDGYTWNECEEVGDLNEIIFRIKWEFDMDNIQTETTRHLELLEE